MRGALGLTALLLATTLLMAMPAGAQSDHSTTLVLDEIGAFNNTNDVHTNEDGNDIPVLYVGETFHLKGQLNDGLGQGLGHKCLNVYIEPSANTSPFATVLTDDDGRFDWFSGDTDDPLSQSGRIEPINGELVGFWSVRLAFEPQNATEGGCATDENETLLASHIDAPFLLKSRIDVLNLGLEEVQPDGVNCTEATCSGLYAGGTYILNLRLMHDRFDAGVNNVSLVYNASLNNESMTSSVQEHVVLTNSTGHAKLHLHVDPDLCCDVEGQALWNISITGEPFYAMLSSSMEPNFNTTQRITVLPYTDGDGDGVHDHHDACPATRANDSVMENGCSDDDHDGVPNEMDACPNQGVFGQDRNEDGCDDANQWNLAIQFTDGCYYCTVEFRSITISVDNHTAYASDDNTNHSSTNADQTITLTAEQPHLEFVFDENHVDYDMSDFEEVQLEIDLKFNEALVYSPYCSTTSGRQFGGGGWDIMPSMDSHLEWNVEFQLNDGEESHEGHKILMNARWASVCTEVYRHTITWSKDPTVDSDNDGSTLPGVNYEGICRENLIAWSGLACDFDRFYVYDLFPNDPTQRWDSDGDGYGDNMSGTNGDAFPYDPHQWSDADGDGYGDNHGWGALYGDDCPNLAGSSYRWVHGCPDFDGDGIPNECVEDSCFQRGFLTWDENGPGTGVVEIIDACPETHGGSSNTRFGCPDADDDGWADPTPASNVGYSDACPDRPGEIEHMGCPEGGEDFMGSGDSVFIGLCTALILLPIMAKLFLMGVAEVRPPEIEPQANRHDSIYDNLLNEAEGADETDEPPEAPVHIGWLDDLD